MDSVLHDEHDLWWKQHVDIMLFIGGGVNGKQLYWHAILIISFELIFSVGYTG